MKTEVIFIQIAGFTIQLCLTPTEYRFNQRLFKKAILKHYQGFIAKNNRQPAHYTITIEGFNTLALHRGKKGFLLDFYKKTGPTTIQTFYHISLVQFNTLVSLITQELLEQYQGLALHASASLIKEKAYIFLGQSGAGKSTISQLLKAQFPLLADDSIYIKKIKREFVVYQTPLVEKNYVRHKAHKAYPLGALFFLKQARHCAIEPVAQDSAIIKQLMELLWVIDEKHLAQPTKLLFELARHYPARELSFTKNIHSLVQLFS